jgi:hypothetical protein
MRRERTHLFDKPENVSRLLRILMLICTALLLTDFITPRHGPDGSEGVPGFYAVFGFVACVMLVLIARQLRKILMRGEDYYEQKR